MGGLVTAPPSPRYNTLATNAQTLNVNLATHVLTRSKAEVRRQAPSSRQLTPCHTLTQVLHVVEQLIGLDAALSEMRDLLTDVVGATSSSTSSLTLLSP